MLYQPKVSIAWTSKFYSSKLSCAWLWGISTHPAKLFFQLLFLYQRMLSELYLSFYSGPFKCCLLHKVTWGSCSPLRWHSGPWKGIMCSCQGWFTPGSLKIHYQIFMYYSYYMPKVEHQGGSAHGVTDSSHASTTVSAMSRERAPWVAKLCCLFSTVHITSESSCVPVRYGENVPLLNSITWAWRKLAYMQ